MITKYQQFFTFVESLKRPGNSALIEAIQSGIRTVMEAEQSTFDLMAQQINADMPKEQSNQYAMALFEKNPELLKKFMRGEGSQKGKMIAWAPIIRAVQGIARSWRMPPEKLWDDLTNHGDLFNSIAAGIDEWNPTGKDAASFETWISKRVKQDVYDAKRKENVQSGGNIRKTEGESDEAAMDRQLNNTEFSDYSLGKSTSHNEEEDAYESLMRETGLMNPRKELSHKILRGIQEEYGLTGAEINQFIKYVSNRKANTTKAELANTLSTDGDAEPAANAPNEQLQKFMDIFAKTTNGYIVDFNTSSADEIKRFKDWFGRTPASNMTRLAKDITAADSEDKKAELQAKFDFINPIYQAAKIELNRLAGKKRTVADKAAADAQAAAQAAESGQKVKSFDPGKLYEKINRTDYNYSPKEDSFAKTTAGRGNTSFLDKYTDERNDLLD